MQLSFPLHRVVLLIAITIIITLGGIYLWLSCAPAAPIVKFNCEQSGGKITKNLCNCSAVEATYNKNTGQCITADGTPGGADGEAVKNLLTCKMKKCIK